MGILRLAHIDVRTPDLDLATAYYTGVMGLQQVSREADRVYFKCWDEEDHHSLRMRYDPRTGLDSFTFRVEREDDLHDFEKRLADYGCQVARVSGQAVGQGESIRFEVPSGQIMELVWDIEKTGNILASATRRPSAAGPAGDRAAADGPCSSTPRRSARPPALPGRAGPAPHRAGARRHATSSASGSRPHQLAARHRSSTAPTAPCTTGLLVDDWDHIRKAADTLAYNGVQIDQGPTRRGVTRGNTIYSSTPSASATRCSPRLLGPQPRSSPDRAGVGKGLLLRERRQPTLPGMHT
jgi:catechol 2,3-dioxygenase